MDATKSLAFFVPGVPRPGGSKRAIPIYRGQKGARQFTGHSVVVDAAGQANKDWKAAVGAAAMEAMNGNKDFPHLPAVQRAPMEGPLVLSLTFYFLRPKSHLRADGVTLAKGRSPYHISKPDCLKLARSTEDAMTGIVWRDDAQIVRYGTLEKAYSSRSGCEIEITPIQ
jgi:Holliday junction resolvase RusA-like endonuclease